MQREEQGDVDVYAFVSALFDSGHPCFGARNLDHHVLAVQRGPKPAGLLDSAVRVVGQQGRALEADKSVGAAGLVIDAREHVGGHLDVPDGKRFVDLL